LDENLDEEALDEVMDEEQQALDENSDSEEEDEEDEKTEDANDMEMSGEVAIDMTGWTNKQIAEYWKNKYQKLENKISLKSISDKNKS